MQKQKISNKKGTKVSTSKKAQVVAGVPVGVPSKRINGIGNGVVVSHRELVGNITAPNTAVFALIGSSGFVPGYDINPANSTLFPWLSRVASAYEKYQFTKLKFEVVPRNPSTVSGSLYVGIDYDWDDPVATTASQIMVNRGAVSSDVWTPVTCEAHADSLNQDMPYRYVESASRGEWTQRMCFAGYLQIGIGGTTVNTAFDLYVDYTVKLQLPALHAVASERQTSLRADTIDAGVRYYPPDIPVPVGLRAGKIGIDLPIGPSWTGANPVAYVVPPQSAGSIRLSSLLGTAGSAPSAFAADTSVDFLGLDTNGSALSTAVGQALNGQPAGWWQGLSNIASWGTPGSNGRTIGTILIDELRKTYPTIAYLVPYISSLGGRVLAAGCTMTTKFSEL